MNIRPDFNLIGAIVAELEPYRDDTEAFWDTLDGETDVLRILDRLLDAHASDGALIDALSAHMDTIKARKERLMDRREAVKHLIGEVLEATGQKKIERPLATVSVRPGLMSVRITEAEEIPSQLMREKVTREPDKAAIKKQLEAGEHVPGADLVQGANIITVRVA